MIFTEQEISMSKINKFCALLICASVMAPVAACTALPEDTTVSESAATVTTSESEETVMTTETFPSYETSEETSADVDTSYVRTLNDVTSDMMRSGYWIANGTACGFDMDEVLMTRDQIKAFNDDNHTSFEREDGSLMFRFDEVGETFPGEDLRYLLDCSRSQIPDDPSSYYLNGQPTSASYWSELRSLDNYDAVPDTIQVRYGFTVKRATLRLFPTEDRVFESASDQYFDYLLFSECMPYMPCLILHESTDGNYYYAVFDSFAAWVRKDVIALCSDRDDWTSRRNPSEVLTVTAREIRLGCDPYSSATSNLVLPMGTHMELVPASSAPASLGQRTTFGDYVVKVPTRGSDGYIADEYVLIPVSDDVVVGYMPYTSANILRQTFKLLGDRYGWGGDLMANDCSGIIREVYGCFGFVIPRTRQTSVNGANVVDISEMNESERIEQLKQTMPGSYVSLPGHMMIYIGTVNDRPYVISAVGSLIQPEPGSTERLHPNSVVLSSLYVRLKSLNTWLESLKRVVTIKPE